MLRVMSQCQVVTTGSNGRVTAEFVHPIGFYQPGVSLTVVDPAPADGTFFAVALGDTDFTSDPCTVEVAAWKVTTVTVAGVGVATAPVAAPGVDVQVVLT